MATTSSNILLDMFQSVVLLGRAHIISGVFNFVCSLLERMSNKLWKNMTIFSFLEGPKAALVASKDFNGGHYNTEPQFGIRAFGRVYSAWAYGQTVSTIAKE